MSLWGEVPVKPDIPSATEMPETSGDCSTETKNWKNAIELPDNTGDWIDSIELPDDSERWRDSINSVRENQSIQIANQLDKDQIKSTDKSSLQDSAEVNLQELLDAYFDDLYEKSEFPETLPENTFSTDDLKKRSPEETAEKREEFDDMRTDLKAQWEKENGRSWPKYENDVYSANGKLIRKAGSDYDAHHIHPLGLGGENEARNITPLHAEVHYDKQGIHAPDSPYNQIDKALERH